MFSNFCVRSLQLHVVAFYFYVALIRFWLLNSSVEVYLTFSLMILRPSSIPCLSACPFVRLSACLSVSFSGCAPVSFYVAVAISRSAKVGKWQSFPLAAVGSCQSDLKEQGKMESSCELICKCVAMAPSPYPVSLSHPNSAVSFSKELCLFWACIYEHSAGLLASPEPPEPRSRPPKAPKPD